MKRIRIAALLVALLLSLAMLTGCNALKIDDVQADPMKYVNDGMKLTLSSTPFSSLCEAQDKMSVEFAIKGDGVDVKTKGYLDTSKKFAIDIDVKTVADNEILGDVVDAVGQDTKIGVYYADKEFAIKTDLLKDIFGTDTIGVDFGITAEELKESALFELLAEISGTTKEALTESFDETFDEDTLKDLKEKFASFGEKLDEIIKNQTVVDSATEETIVIDEKNVDTIVVTLKNDGSALEEIIDELSTFAESLNDLLSEELGDNINVTSTFDELKEYLPKASSTVKYYLSAKSGALVRMTTETESTVMDESEETYETSTSYDVIFGANPEKLFLPSFTYEHIEGEEKYEFDGKASFTDGKFVVEGNGNFYLEDEEPDLGTYKLELSEDDTYILTLVDSDGEYTITGTFASSESGFEFAADVSDVVEEDTESSETSEFSLKLNFAEDVPAMPEYKNIFDFTMEDLAPILSLMVPDTSEYDQMMYSDIMYYYNIDSETLDSYLADYAEYGYTSEMDYMYAIYADCIYQDLVSNYGVAVETLDAIVDSVIDAGGTYYDLAMTMLETFRVYVEDLEGYINELPTEEELKEILDDYAAYGYESIDEAIDSLTDFYGDLIEIPKEYLN